VKPLHKRVSLTPQSDPLYLAGCSFEAAEYAVMHWHYSRTMPVSKRVCFGVWESGVFIGAIIFAWGATPYIGNPFGLPMTQCAELVRIALRPHHAPVSRMIRIAVRLLVKQSPGLRVIVSYADTKQGHHGGIYQAAGWHYLGLTKEVDGYMMAGRQLHRRAYTGHNYGQPRLAIPTGARKIHLPGKHKYVFALDAAMRLQLAPLSQPYPKRGRSAENGTAAPTAGGGINSDPPAPS
jgi:hypothetical protein